MTVKLLTEQHLKFQILKGGCTGSSESKVKLLEITFHGSYFLLVLSFKYSGKIRYFPKFVTFMNLDGWFQPYSLRNVPKVYIR